MNDRYVLLIQKYFESSLSDIEKKEFQELISNNSEFKELFEDQKKVKEVFKTMRFKSPEKELWDGYWESTYNRLERGLGWLAIFIGSLILIGFISIKFVESLYADSSTPIVIKAGIVSLVFGLLVLLFSVIREKFFTYKKDKYKEIKR